MEYIEGKNIGDYITEYNCLFENISLDNLFSQLIDGFCCIEEHGIIHRDIREGNILINKTGIAKIIDFGIGKIFENASMGRDSLVLDINRAGSDTLPQEHYEGLYTSQTDMFYLADLFSRLLKGAKEPECLVFSYQDVLDKMMEKRAKNRYSTFVDIKEAIAKHDFINMTISRDDKNTYQEFADTIYNTILSFIDEQKFNYDTALFIAKLEKSLRDNTFEDFIQNNKDVISSIVTGTYNYDNNIAISCSMVKTFLDWYNASTPQSQKLILANLISKLSPIDVVESETELPF